MSSKFTKQRWIPLILLMFVAILIFVPIHDVSAATYSHTIIMDGNNDFYDSKNIMKARNETFSTSVENQFFYFTWDDTNLYLAYKSPDVTSNVNDAANKWIWVYFGGNGGTTKGINYAGQQPNLPFEAKYHLRYKVNGSYTNLQAWNGSAWTSMNTSIGVNVNNANQYVELRIPRADLGLNTSKTVSLVANLAFEDSNGNNDSMWASVPFDTFTNGNGFNRSYSKFYEFDLQSEQTAAAAQIYSYQFANSLITSSTATFTFLANPNAETVKIQYSTNDGVSWSDGQLLQALNSESTSATVKDLLPKTKYKFRLLVSGGVNVGSSAIVNLTTSEGSPDTIAPSAPSNVTIADVTYQSAKISWTAATDDVAVISYDILRDGTKIDSVSATNVVYIANGLTPETDYVFSIRAVDGAGNLSVVSPPLSVKTLTEPPPNKVMIYYKNGFATPYIHYQPEGGNWTTNPGVLMQPSKLPGYHQIELDIKQATKVNVAFNNGSGTWDNNNNSNYTVSTGTWTYTPGSNGGAGTISAGTPDQIAPTTPTAITISEIKATSISINWSASTDNFGIDSYEVYLNGVLSQTVKEPAVVISNLVTFTSYDVTIKAIDLLGNESSFGNQLTVKTLDNIAPTVPSNLKAESLSDNRFRISWEPAYDNDSVKEYLVFLNGDFLQAISTNEYLLQNLHDLTTYNVTIQAIDQSANASGLSENINITTTDITAPSKPTLQVKEVSENRISFYWTASVDQSEQISYDLYVNDNIWITLNETKYILLDLDEFTKYHVYVIARDDIGNTSEPSDVLQVTTSDISPPTAPETITATEIGNTTFTVNWQASTDNDEIQSYKLLLDGKVVDQSVDTFFVFTDLKERITYSVQVIAVDRSGNESQASEVLLIETLDGTAPSIPEGLKVDSLSGTTMVISWNPSTDEDDQISYAVYVNGVYQESIFDTRYEMTGLTENTTYTIAIQAIDRSNNRSSLSEPLEVTTKSGMKPEAPKGLVAEEIKENEFVIRWQTATDNVEVTAYYIYVNGVKTATVTGQTSYKLMDLKEATTYRVQMSAIDAAANESAFSEELIVTTLDVTGPTVPQNLNIESLNQSGFTINWEAATDNVKVNGYDIYLNSQYVNTVKDTRYVFSGLEEFKTYQVTVRAKDASENTSFFTDALMITTLDITAPTQPVNLIASNQSNQSFTITWNASKDNDTVFGYEVYLNDQFIKNVQGNSYRFEKFADFSTNLITIRAVDPSGNQSLMSPVLSIAIGDTTPPSTPTNLKVHTKTTDSVKISWSGAIDNDRVVAYEVIRNGMKEATVTGLEYTFRGLKDFSKHSIVIKAIDKTGNASLASATMDVTTIDTSAPTAPSNLVASNVSVESFTVKWNASKDNDAIAEYEVYVNDILREKVKMTQYTVTNLKVGEKYKVTVRAIDFNSNVSPLSKPISVEIIDRTAPSIPQKVTIRNVTADGFTVSWMKSSDDVGVANYQVYINGKLLAKTNQNSRKVTGLTTNQVVTITVRAVDRAGNLSAASTALRTLAAIKVYGKDVYINFNKLKFTSSSMPMTSKGVLLVSYKPLLEALGFKVQYDVKSKVITATKNGQTMRMTIGNSTILINGKTKKTMGAAPIIVKGNVMIPIRFFATELKYQYLTK
jgi:chitodextrinase